MSVLHIYPAHTLTWTDYLTRPNLLNWFNMWSLVNALTNFGLRAGREFLNHVNDNKLEKKMHHKRITRVADSAAANNAVAKLRKQVISRIIFL